MSYGYWFRWMFLSVFLAGGGFARGQAEDADGATLRIASYNLRNYLTMDRLVGDRFREDYPKPETEKTVLRRVIHSIDADILAVQEVGSLAMLEELQDDLADEGLDYAGIFVLNAADETRRIGALWKRHVSVEAMGHLDLRFNHFEEAETVKRGLLELKVDPQPEGEGGSQVSVFVVHLKSRYTTDPRDPQARQQRTLEAQAVRDRILDLFPDPANSRFLALGDFNDVRNSSTVRRMLKRGDVEISDIVDARDDDGYVWTHYYVKGGEYSLVDYIFASPGLGDRVVASGIASDRDYYEGSDHRLVWVDLRVGEGD